MHNVDEQRPESSSADLQFEKVFAEKKRFKLPVCDDQKIGEFDSELPFIDEVQNSIAENENALCDVVTEEFHASQIDENGRKARLVGFRAVLKCLNVIRSMQINESGLVGISQDTEDLADA